MPYTKNLIASRGTDNQILIEFVNQDQKRVDLRDKSIADIATTAGSFVVGQSYQIAIVGDTDFAAIGAVYNFKVGTIFIATGIGAGTGTASLVTYTDLEFTCRIISADDELLLLEKPLVVVNREAGQTKLVLTEEELDKIIPGNMSFSIEQTANNNLYEPVYVDDSAGTRGVIEIVDGILPLANNSSVLTIPEGQTAPPIISSILNTDAVDTFTFQLIMDNYTGSIVVEGATDTDNQWYEIQTEIVSESNLLIFNVFGYHPYVRFSMTDATDVGAGSFKIGDEYSITLPGTTDFTLIGAADNFRGTVFTATGPGTGDGTATPTDPAFPGTVTEIRYR